LLGGALPHRVAKIGCAWLFIVFVFIPLPRAANYNPFRASVDGQVSNRVERFVLRNQVRHMNHRKFSSHSFRGVEVMALPMAVHLPIATRMRNEQHREPPLNNATARDSAKVFRESESGSTLHW